MLQPADTMITVEHEPETMSAHRLWPKQNPLCGTFATLSYDMRHERSGG